TTRYSLDDTEVEKVARSEDAVETTVVSVDRSRGTSPKSEPDDGEEVNEEIQVLDPETHETTTVRCPPFVSPSQGGSVTVVKTRGRLLLLPDD
ncbi:MAG: hypothetical protein SV760_02290, partial [Halobacteria archaeon]|nr:hypothetical protein [Halobacteria archaeon]